VRNIYIYKVYRPVWLANARTYNTPTIVGRVRLLGLVQVGQNCEIGHLNVSKVGFKGAFARWIAA
jgi:hypothetical protein